LSIAATLVTRASRLLRRDRSTPAGEGQER
jgi:hypothetical protein